MASQQPTPNPRFCSLVCSRTIPRHLLGVVLMAMVFVHLYLLLAVWPEAVEEAGQWQRGATIWGNTLDIGPEPRLILIVLLSGGIGALIHAIKSYVSFVGANRFRNNWFWWYLFRAPTGALLALVFYFALRGGLLVIADGKEAAGLRVFGVVSIATMVGLFSEQAIHKLRELFDTLFNPRYRAELPDKLDDPGAVQPLIERVEPARVVVNQAVSLKVYGREFSERIEAQLGGRSCTVERLDERDIVVTCAPHPATQQGQLELVLINRDGGGKEYRSEPWILEVVG